MHKLDRTTVQPPACLDNYDHNTQRWDDFASDCKRALRAALVQMQGIPGVTVQEANEFGLRCAYCEGYIRHEGHIEHFRRKNPKHFPELTFNWHNLFLACGSNDHCGHYKDRPSASPYNASDLIKPDIEDPDHFLYFHSSGQARPLKDLDADSTHRATETIRVFGLDSSVLSGARSRALTTYKQKIFDDLNEIASWSEADRNIYLVEEIEATQWQPYATTIKHFLQSHS